MLEGDLEFLPPDDQSNITDYAVYLLDTDGAKLKYLGDVNVKRQEEIKAYRRSIGLYMPRYGFPMKDLTIPETAVKFGIYPKNASGESETGLTVPIWDNPRHRFATGIGFVDNNKKKGINAVLKWKPLEDEKPVSGYKLFYTADGSTLPLTDAAIDVPKGQSEYMYEVPEGLIPERASGITVYAYSAEGVKGPGAYSSVIDDITEEPIVSLTPTGSIPAPTITDVIDNDQKQGLFSGYIHFQADDRKFDPGDPSSGASPLSYGIYFLDGNKQKLKGIASVPRDTDRSGFYYITVPSGIVIPKEAVYIGVFAQLATAEGIAFGEKFLWDRPFDQYQPKHVKFTDEDPNPGSVKAKVSWQAADNEAPLFGYSIYIDWKDNKSKPYTTVKKGQSAYEFTFPDGALPERNHFIYIVPVNESGERPFDAVRPTVFVPMVDSSGTRQASLKPTGLSIYDLINSWFVDTDDRPGLIGGKVSFQKWNNVKAVSYEFYFIDALNRERTFIAEIEDKPGPQNPAGYPLEIPNGTPIPDGAVFIGVKAKLADGSEKPLGGFVIQDNSAGNKQSFGDIPENNVFKKEIEGIASLGLISGYEDGSFGPDKPVTRAEFAAMLVRTLRLDRVNEQRSAFSDVGPGDWFADSVATAVECKLLSGYEDGSFRPHQPISRKEMAIMVYNAYLMNFEPMDHGNAYIEYYDNYEIPEWSRDAVSGLKRLSMLPRLSYFEPNKPVSRGESAFMLYRLMERYYLVKPLVC